MQGVRPPVVNPDEMDTLPFFPGLKGTIPDGPPPSCLGAVLGAIHLHPPWLDYRLQQKKHFKEVVLNLRGEGTQSVTIASSYFLLGSAKNEFLWEEGLMRLRGLRLCRRLALKEIFRNIMGTHQRPLM